MFDIKKHEIKQCSINEFNGILDILKDRQFKFETAHSKDVGTRVYLWSNISKAYLVYNDYLDNKIVTRCLETDLNDLYEDGYWDKMESTMRSASICGKALKFPRIVQDKSEATVNASGIIWTNPKYNKKNVYCYEYDMHLAWLSTFMECALPNTAVEPRLKDNVREGEIGFLKNGLGGYNCGDSVVFEGYADYIFPIIYNPNPLWCAKLLEEINKATGLDRRNLKGRFNKWLGTMQNKNPYIRVAVIAQSNKKIINLIRKYKNLLIFSVADSLGATQRIPELDNMIGNKAGCWSIKNEGYLFSDKNNRLYLDNQGYITNTSIRGVPSEHIKGLNITEYLKLTSKRDPDKNLYKINNEERRIVPNER